MKNTFQYISAVLIISSVGLAKLNAQQYVQFTHYMYNTLAVNPAYAGSHEALNITGLYRNQWVGLEGAPESATIYLHTPIFKGLSIGASVLNDRIGPINLTNVAADLSYGFRVSEKGKLAFGIKTGANLYSASTLDLLTVQGADPSVQNDALNTSHFNFGAGTYYYTDNFYAGFSVPTILKDELNVGNAIASSQMHYYLIMGGITPLGENLKFKPSGLLKMTQNAPLSLDLSAQFLIREKLWLGAMHRFGDAFGGLIGYQFSPQLKAGYSYDLNISKLNAANSGSHEVFISYDFNFTHDKIISPRYF